MRVHAVLENVDKYILKNVNLRLDGPSCVALVGPNGSGKTTILRLIAGVLAPSSGKVRVLGRDPFRDHSVREIINYVATGPLTDQGESAKDYLKLYYSLTPRARRRVSVEEALQKVNLPKRCWGPLIKLSEGQKRKVELAKLLIKEAAVNLVDEPTEFLDAQSREWVKNLLSELKNESLLVVATHDLDLVRSLADKVFVVTNGSVRPVDINVLEEVIGVGVTVRGVAVVRGSLNLIEKLRKVEGVLRVSFRPRVNELLKALGIDVSTSSVAVFTSVEEAKSAFGESASFVTVSGLQVKYDFEISVRSEIALKEVLDLLFQEASIEELHVVKGVTGV